MKKNILTAISSALRSKVVLAVSGSMILMSCGAHMGAYEGSDGVYYDPETDTLPEGVIVDSRGNQVGEYYDYNDNSVIDNARYNKMEKDNRYSQWNDDDYYGSDWGSFAGNETNFYSDYWGYPYGWYSHYWGSGWGIGLSWGWGSFYNSWYGYNPYMFGYGPYWSAYNPYWGYGGMYGYNPYYAGYSPYYYGGYYYPQYYQNNTSTPRSYNSYLNNGSPFIGNAYKTASTSGFRNGIQNSVRTTPRSFNTPSAQTDNSIRSNSTRPRYTNPRYGTDVPRTQPRQMPRYDSNPRYQSNPRMESTPRNNGGFRNDSGFRGNSGGFNGGSSGGFRGGSSGSPRSGGFR